MTGPSRARVAVSICFTTTRLAVTPVPPSSRARARISVSSAAFATAYEAPRGPGVIANGVETATIRPQPRSVIPGTTAWATLSVVQRCCSSIVPHLVVVEVHDGGPAGPPADQVEPAVDAPEAADDGVDGRARRDRIRQVTDPRRPSIVRRCRPSPRRRRGDPRSVPTRPESRPTGREHPGRHATEADRSRPVMRTTGSAGIEAVMP